MKSRVRKPCVFHEKHLNGLKHFSLVTIEPTTATALKQPYALTKYVMSSKISLASLENNFFVLVNIGISTTRIYTLAHILEIRNVGSFRDKNISDKHIL